MNNNKHIILLKRSIKVVFLGLALLCLSGNLSYGQSCDCPAAGTCGPCEGGLINLTLEYTGGIVVSVSASDDSGPVGASFLSSEILVESATPGQPFDGNVTVNVTYLSIPVNLVDTETFVTSCSPPLFSGTVQGNFIVLGGESLSGGVICCEESNVDSEFPTITGCPSDINLNIGSACSSTVNWTEPVASDNCNVASFVSSHNSGDTFSVGTTTVTYTATDDYGNETVCSFDVSISEDVDPTLSGCPSDFFFFADASCEKIVNWSPPSASDNCTSPIVPIGSHNPGDSFGVGTTEVTYTATDDSGNVATCSFNVTILDNTDPVFVDCPSDITVSANGSCEAVVNWTVPTVNDNCTAITPSGNFDPGDTFSLGTTQVVYMATDDAGNDAFCFFNVEVIDDTPPVISGCPSDIIVSANGSCEAIVNWTPPTATDNCTTPINPTSPFSSGDTFGLGTTTVIYTATDGTGNSATCSFDVTVLDDTPPVISGCPSDIIVSANGSCEAIVNWTPPSATDNCTTPITPASPFSSGDTFGLGTTTVIYTATDDAGHSATCSFDVTVIDDTPPVITGCPTDIVVSANGSCEAIVNWTPPNATDNCTAPITPVSSLSSGDTFGLGTTTVTYTATDDAGNSAICSFDVTVIDDTAPVITGCPTDIIVSANGICEAIVNWTPPNATDNCTTPVTPNSAFSSGDTFNLGTTTVTYTATDDAGNSAVCSFDVTVIDDTAPVITGCPTNITVSANGSCEAIVNWTLPNATDNCTTPLTPISAFSSGDTFGLGTTTVTYTATDGAGNSATCSFDVTVIDDTPPVIAGCPSDIIVSADGSCEAVVNWTTPNATDNCTATVTPTSPFNSGDTFGLGTTTVTYTSTDDAGNSTICSFDVTVIDDTSPVITGCPTDIIVQDDGSCGTIVNWTPPNATDNCSTLTPTSSFSPGDSFGVGTTLITYIATDDEGNSSSCSFNVIIQDISAPVINNTPTDIQVEANENCEAVVSWQSPTVEDCSETTLTSNFNSGGVFPLGTTSVTYVATNANGLETTSSFNVIVEDKSTPAISQCPGNIEVTTNASCETTVTWQVPVVSDNCGSFTTTSNFQSGDVFPLGVTEIVYTATDNEGNTANCTFNVVVKNENLPTIEGCPTNISAETGESGSVEVTWEPPTASIVCGSVTLESTHNPGDKFDIGTTQVIYTATDEVGDEVMCTFDVTVTYEEVDFAITPLVTPNNDGVNDVWLLPNIEKYSNNEVRIVDRWGSEVYSASGYDNDQIIWDGTNKNGALVPTGTYFYYISVNFVSSTVEKTGFIELIR